MKKIFIAGALLAANLFPGFAQDDDVLTLSLRGLRMSKTDPVYGTARYSAMGGAMDAFGADASTMRDNPAGLGVYRKSDITFTLNVNSDNDGGVHCNVNNFGFIWNFGGKNREHGYVTSSLAFAYNRLGNYHREDYTYGTYGDGYEYENNFVEKGGSGEWNIAYGLNISNHFFFGAGVNIMNIDYEQNTNFNSEEDNNFYMNASGANFTLGTIIKPADFVNISLGFKSPTWLTVTEDAYYPMRNDDNEIEYNHWGEMEYGGYEGVDYELQTPLQVNGGLGFVVGKRAAIGIDYKFQDYSCIVEKNSKGKFRDAEKFEDKNYQATHTIKAGAEVQIAKGWAVRGGFAYETSPTKDGMYNPVQYDNVLYSYTVPKESMYFTGGFGFHSPKTPFYADFAYVRKNQKEDFYEWQSVDDKGNYEKSPIKQTIGANNFIVTLGFKL